MDATILLAMSGMLIAWIGSTLAMFLWIRSEANADRREGRDLISSIEKEMKDFHNEMKDFHGRLCKIEEERNLKILSFLANKN